MKVKHQADTARKWRSAIRRVELHLTEDLPPLFFLTDPERTPDPVSVAKTLPPGSGIIYRHFGRPDRFETAHSLAKAAQQIHGSLLIAADPVLAKHVGADGVHWPEVRLTESRAWRGRFRIQTASAHSRRAIWKAHLAMMDAVFVSSVFPSVSPSAGSPMGPARLRQLCQTAALPIYGLGGITGTNAMRIADHVGLASVSSAVAFSGC